MYAIQNIKTGKFVYGTDYRYYPRRQLTSRNRMLTYEFIQQAESDFFHRHCGKDYRIVVLKTVEVKRVLDRKSKEQYFKDCETLKYWEMESEE